MQDNVTAIQMLLMYFAVDIWGHGSPERFGQGIWRVSLMNLDAMLA